MASTPENRVKNAIMNYLKSLKESGHPIYYERRQASGTAPKGLPDLFCIYNGIHVEIECKKNNGGELSTMQEKQRDILINAGCFYIVPHSKEDFVSFFTSIMSLAK